VKDLDISLPKKNIVSMKVYVYKYIEKNKLSEVELKKELENLL